MTVTRDPFVGRESELEQLIAHGGLLQDGTGWVDLIAGEPGIGKSRLVQEYLVQQHLTSVTGNCLEGGVAPPYWPWKQIIESLCKHADLDLFNKQYPNACQYLNGLNPFAFGRYVSDAGQVLDTAELQAGEHQFYLFHAVYELLAFLLSDTPLVIILEDLHWADDGSCDLLKFIVSQVGGLALHVIGTYRNTDLGSGTAFAPLIGMLQAEPMVSVTRLGGLSEMAIDTLMRDMGVDSDSRTLAAEVRSRTDGNSLFVKILASELSQNTDSTRLRSLPEGIRHLVARMVAKLDPDHYETMCYAAILGREYPIKLLSQVLEDHPLQQIIDAIDGAVGFTILDPIPPGGDSYRFHHEVIRHAIIEELSLSKRVQMHARCATRLEALREHDHGITDEELFRHFSESEVINGPEKVAQYALNAGNNALQIRDYVAAESYFRPGVEAVNKSGTEIYAWLNIGLSRCGRMRFDVHNEEYRIRLKTGLEYSLAQHDSTSLREMLKAIDPPIQGDSSTAELMKKVLPLVDDDEEMQLSLAESIRYGLRFDDQAMTPELSEFLEKGVEKAETENPLLAVRILDSQAHLCHLKGEYKEQLALGLRIGEIDKAGDPRFIFRRYHHLEDTLGRLGRYPEVVVDARETEQIAVDHISDFGARWTLAWIHGVYVDSADWESEVRVRNIMETAQPRIMMRAFDWSQNRMWLEFDDLIAVNRYLDSADLDSVYELLYQLMYFPIYSIKTGDDRYASSLRCVISEGVHSSIPRVHVCRAAALAFLGMVDDDRDAVERNLPQIDLQMHDYPFQIIGVLKAYLGDTDGAVQTLEQGLEFRVGRTLRVAWFHFHLAEVLASVDSKKAAKHLTNARDMADQYGLQLLRRRIGELDSKPAVSARNIGKHGLTTRELEILKEIVTGKTDAEIADTLYISAKTVSNHVGNILKKTGVGNRTEAARIARDQNLLS